MTVFSYKATDKSGKFVEGDIDAPDYHTAIQQIRQLNFFPVKVAEGKSSSKEERSHFDIESKESELAKLEN